MAPFFIAARGMGMMCRQKKTRKKTDAALNRKIMSDCALIPVIASFATANVLPQMTVVASKETSALTLGVTAIFRLEL